MPDWFDERVPSGGITGGLNLGTAIAKAGQQMMPPGTPPKTPAGYPSDPGGSIPPEALTTLGNIMSPWTREFSSEAFDPGALPSFTPETYTPTGFRGVAGFKGPGTFKGVGAFKAPTVEEAMADPATQFRLKYGVKAREGAAAGRGTLLTGGTLKGLEDYAQEVAATGYGDVYGRKFGEHQQAYGEAFGEHQQTYNEAFGEHQQAYNEAYQPWQAAQGFGLQATGLNNQAALSAAQLARSNALDTWRNNYERALTAYGISRENFYAGQDRPYNKLLPLISIGQAGANSATAAGAGYANAGGDILTGQQGGEYATQAANAAAAGRVGSGNAWSDALGQIGQGATDLYLSKNLGRRTRVPGAGQYYDTNIRPVYTSP